MIFWPISYGNTVTQYRGVAGSSISRARLYWAPPALAPTCIRTLKYENPIQADRRRASRLASPELLSPAHLTLQLGAGPVTSSGRPACLARAPRNHSYRILHGPYMYGTVACPATILYTYNYYTILIHSCPLIISCWPSARAMQSHTPPDAQRVQRSAPYNYGYLIEAFIYNYRSVRFGLLTYTLHCSPCPGSRTVHNTSGHN